MTTNCDHCDDITNVKCLCYSCYSSLLERVGELQEMVEYWKEKAEADESHSDDGWQLTEKGEQKLKGNS